MGWGELEKMKPLKEPKDPAHARTSLLEALGLSNIESELVKKIEKLQVKAGCFDEMRATIIVNARHFGLNLNNSKLSCTQLFILVLGTAMNVQKFGTQVLDQAKERIGSGEACEEDEAIMELACSFGLVEQVAYDPEIHGKEIGDHGLVKGDLIWWWGKS